MAVSVKGVGYVATDPQLRVVSGDVPMVNFRWMSNRHYRQQGGERVSDGFNVVAWRDDAKFVDNYVSKGDRIEIEGYLQERRYTPQGSDRETRVIEIVATQITLINRVGERKERGDELIKGLAGIFGWNVQQIAQADAVLMQLLNPEGTKQAGAESDKPPIPTALPTAQEAGLAATTAVNGDEFTDPVGSTDNSKASIEDPVANEAKDLVPA